MCEPREVQGVQAEGRTEPVGDECHGDRKQTGEDLPRRPAPLDDPRAEVAGQQGADRGANMTAGNTAVFDSAFQTAITAIM